MRLLFFFSLFCLFLFIYLSSHISSCSFVRLFYFISLNFIIFLQDLYMPTQFTGESTNFWQTSQVSLHSRTNASFYRLAIFRPRRALSSLLLLLLLRAIFISAKCLKFFFFCKKEKEDAHYFFRDDIRKKYVPDIMHHEKKKKI